MESAFGPRRGRETSPARARAKRCKLETALAKLDAAIGDGRSGRAKRRGGAAVQRKPNARRLNDVTLADALERALKTFRRPTNYVDLTNAVVRRRLYRTKSKNLLSTVAVTLKRDGRFKRVKPGEEVVINGRFRGRRSMTSPRWARRVGYDSSMDRRVQRALRAAKRRRRTLASTLARLGAEIEGLQRDLHGAGFGTRLESRIPNAARFNDRTAADAAAEVLRAGPMQLTALTHTITQRGLYVTAAKDPRATVARALAKDDRFVRIGLGRYTLRSGT